MRVYLPFFFIALCPAMALAGHGPKKTRQPFEESSAILCQYRESGVDLTQLTRIFFSSSQEAKVEAAYLTGGKEYPFCRGDRPFATEKVEDGVLIRGRLYCDDGSNASVNWVYYPEKKILDTTVHVQECMAMQYP